MGISPFIAAGLFAFFNSEIGDRFARVENDLDDRLQVQIEVYADEFLGYRRLSLHVSEFRLAVEKLRQDHGVNASSRGAKISPQSVWESILVARRALDAFYGDDAKSLAGVATSEIAKVREHFAEDLGGLSSTLRGVTEHQALMDLDQMGRFEREGSPLCVINIDVASASGIVLLSGPGLARELQPGWPRFRLYERHPTAPAEATTYPEYRLLYNLLIQRELGATREELRASATSMRGVCSRRLSRSSLTADAWLVGATPKPLE